MRLIDQIETCGAPVLDDDQLSQMFTDIAFSSATLIQIEDGDTTGRWYDSDYVSYIFSADHFFAYNQVFQRLMLSVM